MRSQLTDANISGIIGIGDWVADFVYSDAGNMTSRTIQSSSKSFTYSGQQMTNADGNGLVWDENGQLITGVDVNLVWNWDGMLREANTPSKSVSLRYDPSGNRIFKDSSQTGQRKYIVDIVGDLPVILMDLEKQGQVYNIKKIYIYANSQVLAQHDGDSSDDLYFYLHDRLGSVRQIINTTDGDVVKLYTYNPFGETLEDQGTLSNPFMFAGQFYDSEISEYYLRARMYDPYISRFTARDPVAGKFEEPLTLHAYLYCGNDPINYIDPDGKWAIVIGASLSFNAGEASNFISAINKQFGLPAAAMARNAIIGNIMDNFVADHVGFTGGVGAAFGYGKEDGWFIGSVYWAASGVANGLGLTATADYAWSNAQKLQDLAGNFIEVGGSVTGGPLGPFLRGSVGGSISRGIGTDIYLATFSIGGGITEGREVHGFVGRSWVAEW